jgi:hypothetical protein
MSLTAPNPIIKPFCNTGTQVAPPVGADSLVANQETGFPDSQATPLPIGTEVQQNEMNGVLRLYTSLLLWLNSGGQFTFNQAFSDANNGYALDNILWCASNSTFQRSLVANNTANFVTTPSYINDGINWIDVNNASFPDIQDNPTTGNVTIGGRVPNSVNNIKTLSNDGKLSGMVTGFESSVLYVTEPDGETINTAVVNQYGYRPFHNGTATEILDPANTFAYVSELPVVSAAPKYRTFVGIDATYLQIHAVYDPIQMVWLCSCSGESYIPADGKTLALNIDLSSVVPGTTQNSGTASLAGQLFPINYATTFGCVMKINSILSVFLQLANSFVGAVPVHFSLVFTATEII